MSSAPVDKALRISLRTPPRCDRPAGALFREGGGVAGGLTALGLDTGITDFDIATLRARRTNERGDRLAVILQNRLEMASLHSARNPLFSRFIREQKARSPR